MSASGVTVLPLTETLLVCSQSSVTRVVTRQGLWHQPAALKSLAFGALTRAGATRSRITWAGSACDVVQLPAASYAVM